MTTEEVIIATLKVMSKKLVSATEESYLSHYSVILATEEVITAFLKII